MNELTQTYSAADIATALGRTFMPSPHQTTIIEAPLESSIVIAGAGSGKTETMANRVVYLVANGFVRVDEVLGMTFTRKAANELANRVRGNLADLTRSGLVIPGAAGQSLHDDMLGATITTYNAFANRIYADFAHLIGRDPDARVMSEASAWQLARLVAEGADEEDMLSINKSLDDIAEAILSLSRGLNDNMSSAENLAAYGESFAEFFDGLPDGKISKTRLQPMLKVRAIADGLPRMARLVRDYDALKRGRSQMEFSDQVSGANQIVTSFDEVGLALRKQYKVVLLDEYQDTSNVQIELLANLFRGLAVTAVGDPNQAIYGWRGASASSMHTGRFFAKYAPTQSARPVFELPESWRNPQVVLTAANAVASLLPHETDEHPIDLALGSEATTGSLTTYYPETVREEAELVAAWFTDQIAKWEPRPGVSKDAGLEKPTAALLVRRIADLEEFKLALDRHDVPYRVVGLGGLMVDPVIVDLVCALRVLHFANAESELVRLLAGPKWRIAPRDLRALHKTATWLAGHDYARKQLDEQVVARLRESVAAEDGASLIDALDFVSERPDKDHYALRGLSDDGFERLRDAGLLFADLRRRVGLDLRELVVVVMQALNLDIEGEANDTTASVEPVISAFLEAVNAYLSTADDVTLGSFLKWLADAERRDRMSPAAADAEPGVVQLMTIHGAKGLEWHLVAVPRQSEMDKATVTRNGETWATFGVVPDELRADIDDLTPWWGWKSVTDRDTLAKEYDTYKAGAVQRYKNEQRRLAYVAFTRSMQHLLVTGSFWSGTTTSRGPNEYLRDIAAVTDGVELPEQSVHTKLPESAGVTTVEWPLSPFGARSERVHRAAELVRSADRQPPAEIARDIELLVAERERRAQIARLPLPTRIAASRFKDFIEKPGTVAQQLRRPMPSEPYRATMLGTIFHAWVEALGKSEETLPGFDAHASGYSSDLLDVITERDLDADDQPGMHAIDEVQLEKLKATFLASEWGTLRPYRTELEIQLPLGPNIVICKIDAIYRHETAAGVRYDIVDWKTGKTPTDATDLEARQYQLALYRLAFAKWANLPLTDVDAALYFVAHDTVIRPEVIFDEQQLLDRWGQIFGD